MPLAVSHLLTSLHCLPTTRWPSTSISAGLRGIDGLEKYLPIRSDSRHMVVYLPAIGSLPHPPVYVGLPILATMGPESWYKIRASKTKLWLRSLVLLVLLVLPVGILSVLQWFSVWP